MKKILIICFCLMALGVSGQSLKKIDYEIHERGQAHGERSNWISAIIAPVNPAKDDYKGYCRYIVKDIVKKKGYNVEICIYDNKRAYSLYEDKRHIINKENDAFVIQHTISVYDGNTGEPDWGESYRLNFYLDSKGTSLEKYGGHETFKP